MGSRGRQKKGAVESTNRFEFEAKEVKKRKAVADTLEKIQQTIAPQSEESLPESSPSKKRRTRSNTPRRKMSSTFGQDVEWYVTYSHKKSHVASRSYCDGIGAQQFPQIIQEACFPDTWDIDMENCIWHLMWQIFVKLDIQNIKKT